MPETIYLPTAQEVRKNPKTQSFRDLIQALTNEETRDLAGVVKTKRAMIVQNLLNIALHGTTVLPFSREMAAIAIANGDTPQPQVIAVNTEQWLSTVKFLLDFMDGKAPTAVPKDEVPEDGKATFEVWKKTVEFRRRSVQRAGQTEVTESGSVTTLGGSASVSTEVVGDGDEIWEGDPFEESS